MATSASSFPRKPGGSLLSEGVGGSKAVTLKVCVIPDIVLLTACCQQHVASGWIGLTFRNLTYTTQGILLLAAATASRNALQARACLHGWTYTASRNGIMLRPVSITWNVCGHVGVVADLKAQDSDCNWQLLCHAAMCPSMGLHAMAVD